MRTDTRTMTSPGFLTVCVWGRGPTSGLYFFRNNPTVSNPVKRVIVLQNAFEMNSANGAQAISFLAYTDTLTTPGYDTLVIRGNRIRPLASDSGISGITAQSVNRLTIDKNWVDVTAHPDWAVARGSAGAVQVFNNRKLSGELVPVSIQSTLLHQGELTTEAELLYAGL